MFYQIQQSQYPDYYTAPMAAELTDAGFESLKTAEEVENILETDKGTVLVFVNSVCGCAASNARPAAIVATRGGKLPEKMVTVFAGVDAAAVQKARDYFLPYPPSSPSIALFKDGALVHFVERHHIMGRPVAAIANDLKQAFETYC